MRVELEDVAMELISDDALEHKVGAELLILFNLPYRRWP